jgi:hypothetical protein
MSSTETVRIIDARIRKDSAKGWVVEVFVSTGEMKAYRKEGATLTETAELLVTALEKRWYLS